jgi:phenylpropionate dioxygenase-like ring-hydroxylating dioxygenase large terminal subunit
MGELFRQYWIPVLPVAHVAESDGAPKRVRLLGEDLVLFRTRRGEAGLVGAYCSHRLAPLFFGRIEDDGIRCPYHGWKYSPQGKCIEMPNVPPGQEFKEDICHPGYPCSEYGGIIWAYMGTSKHLPPLPQFEFALVTDELRSYRPFRQDCNYLQAMEGGIDPTHVMWLHSPYNLSDDEIAKDHQRAQQRLANKSGTRTPLAIEIIDTPGGFMYGTKRPIENGSSLWRVNQFLMPFNTMPPGGDFRMARMWVPMDDDHCVKWDIGWFPTQMIKEKTNETARLSLEQEQCASPANEPYGFIIPRANKSNDYLIDWEVHKTRRLGVPGVNLQDICITENEGPGSILDRARENLCSGDMTIIKARRMLLRAAKELREQGILPPGVKDPGVYRLRGTAKVVPDHIGWVEGVWQDVTVSSGTAVA